MSVKIVMLIFVSMAVFASAMHFNAKQNGKPNNSKKVWSPPDGSFTVELPVELEEIKGEYDDISQDGYRSIKLFGSSEADTPKGVFQVVVLDLSEKGRSDAQGKLEGLEFLIGGDDRKPTKERRVKIEGLPAKEVLFVSPSKCSKGLMIDAGDRIYVLGLVVDTCDGLDSAVSKRFFESFRLTRRK